MENPRKFGVKMEWCKKRRVDNNSCGGKKERKACGIYYEVLWYRYSGKLGLSGFVARKNKGNKEKCGLC